MAVRNTWSQNKIKVTIIRDVKLIKCPGSKEIT